MASKDETSTVTSQGKKYVKKVMWILNSGCSNPMTGDKALLLHFEEKVDPHITFEDDKKGFTTGCGNLEV